MWRNLDPFFFFFKEKDMNPTEELLGEGTNGRGRGKESLVEGSMITVYYCMYM
jgi:hypothetical protein